MRFTPSAGSAPSRFVPIAWPPESTIASRMSFWLATRAIDLVGDAATAAVAIVDLGRLDPVAGCDRRDEVVPVVLRAFVVEDDHASLRRHEAGDEFLARDHGYRDDPG
jgi:hypothetical protein